MSVTSGGVINALKPKWAISHGGLHVLHRLLKSNPNSVQYNPEYYRCSCCYGLKWAVVCGTYVVRQEGGVRRLREVQVAWVVFVVKPILACFGFWVSFFVVKVETWKQQTGGDLAS